MPDKSTVVVLINVFTVEPANQERLVALLARATDGSINRAPGLHFCYAPSQHRRHKSDHVCEVAERRGLPRNAPESRCPSTPR